MNTAKLFVNGQSQAVRLPKECRFDGTEVGLTKIGDMVVLYPIDKAEELFFSSLGSFTDDMFDAVLDGRGNEAETQREKL